MEVIVAFAVVFVVGYSIGRARSRRKRHPTTTSDNATRNASARLPRTSRGYRSREREYGGFGALGATNDPGDFGDFGP